MTEDRIAELEAEVARLRAEMWSMRNAAVSADERREATEGSAERFRGAMEQWASKAGGWYREKQELEAAVERLNADKSMRCDAAMLQLAERAERQLAETRAALRKTDRMLRAVIRDCACGDGDGGRWRFPAELAQIKSNRAALAQTGEGG